MLLMGLLYWISSLHGVPVPDDPQAYALFQAVPPSAQNALHVPAYAVLSWAWHWALRAWVLRHPRRLAIAGAVSGAYGILDEWHQSFVPGRYASLIDIVFDGFGVALGLWLAARYAAPDTGDVAAPGGPVERSRHDA